MNPNVTIPLRELSQEKVDLTPRVRELRQVYFRARPEVCIERARLVTQFSLKNNLFARDRKRISILEKARLYRYALERRAPIVRHTHGYEMGEQGLKRFEFKDPQLFAGSTTGKFKGVPLFPEFMALTIWPELWTISRRANNPYHLNPGEAEELNRDIFPHWVHNNILEIARGKCSKKQLDELKIMERIVFFIVTKPECISHAIPDFSRAIDPGIGAIRDEAKEQFHRAAEESKKEFFQSMVEVLEGVIAYSGRLAKEAQRLAAREPDPAVRKELLEMAEIHRRVPGEKARTFREALTTIWVCLTAIHLENPDIGISLGRLDQILYPSYREDLKQGRVKLAEAVELLCFFFLKLGDHVPMVPKSAEELFGGTGSNQAITIGGVDKNGKDGVNDLTFLILRAIELMNLRDPNLNARVHPENRWEECPDPDIYLKRLCEANLNTRATPALHNDEAVFKALEARGDKPQDAVRDYAIVGCVEPVSSGTYGSCSSIILNLTSALELALFNGRHRNIGLEKKIVSFETQSPDTFRSFPEFKEFFRRQVRWLADCAADLHTLFGKVHQDFYPTPTLSAFFQGPMEKGVDLVNGGARINSSGVSVIGLADVADSLSAIQEVVLGGKAPVPFQELLGALRRDWEGNESLLERIRTYSSKFGNDGPSAAQNNAKWLLAVVDSAFKDKVNCRGGGYRAGYWTMTNHAAFGRLAGATPNGRRKGENFSSGITPVSGATPNLPGVLNSVANLPARLLSNGVALNIKFTPDAQNKRQMAKVLCDQVKAYFLDTCRDKEGRERKRDGGMEIQFNITSHEAFKRVHDNPALDPSLLVRVSGYTAYFKDLTPQMRVEIINRTEYQLASGKAKPYTVISPPK